MRTLTIILTTFLFFANVLLSSAESLMVCAHSDHIHIVDVSTHSHNQISEDDVCGFLSHSDCVDILLESSIFDFSNTNLLKTPILVLKELPLNQFQCHRVAAFKFEKSFQKNNEYYRLLPCDVGKLPIPLLI